MDGNIYDADYYERGIETGKSLYTRYHWMPEATIRLAVALTELLGIEKHETILDFGCAKGYLVRALHILGFHRTTGIDVSEYAVSCCPKEIAPYIVCGNSPSCFPGAISEGWDWMIAKDVFEHLHYHELKGVLADTFETCSNVFVAVPLGNGVQYNIPAYNMDRSHVTRESKAWWISTFEESGFEVVGFERRIPGIKDNWSAWEDGNGFFVLKGNRE